MEEQKQDFSMQSNFSEQSNLTLTNNAVFFLKQSAPWIKFISILGFVYCGLIIVIGLVSVVFMLNEPMTLLIALLYFALAIVMYFPLNFLYKYASNLKYFCESGNSAELETAFNMQKKFWKFQGIMTIIGIGLMAIFLVIAVIAGLSTFMF